jgi:hypothetical protein
LQPCRKLSAFAIFNPSNLSVLQDSAIKKPRRPIWSAFHSDRPPGLKVENIVCCVWASQSDCCEVRIEIGYGEVLPGKGQFWPWTDEKSRSATSRNIYDLTIFLDFTIELPILTIYTGCPGTQPFLPTSKPCRYTEHPRVGGPSPGRSLSKKGRHRGFYMSKGAYSW